MKRGSLAFILLLTILLTGVTSFEIDVYCQKEFSIVGVNVKSSSGSSNIYPGSRRVSLRIEAIYVGVEAETVVGLLKTPTGIEFSAGSGSSAPAKFLNGSVAYRVKTGDYITFDYLLDISNSLQPGTYNLILNITYRSNSNLSYEEHTIAISVYDYPGIFLRVVDGYLSPATYPGSSDTNLYVLLENTGDSTINSASFNLSLPKGFIADNSKATVGLVNKGERFTLTFSGVSIPIDASIGVYTAEVYVDASMRTEDGVAYNDATTFNVQFSVTTPPREDPIMISYVSVTYRGEAAPLLPSARGVTLRIGLINRLSDVIGAMSIIPLLPNGMEATSISGTYVNGMGAGGSSFIDITVDVDSTVKPGQYDGLLSISYVKIVSGASFLAYQNVRFQITVDVDSTVKPGQYDGLLSISYVKIVSGASFLAYQNVRFQITVESFHSYVPELAISSTYWGSPNPNPAYESSQYTPLTLSFINKGRYDIVGGFVNVSSKYLRTVKGSETLPTRLMPGSSASVTLYFDINASIKFIPIEVSVDYIFDEFGTHIEVTRRFIINLPIEKYPASNGKLSIVDSGWQNNYSVFPETDNATYQVTIANRTPFSIGGINLILKLPKGMTSSGRDETNAYIEGPIRSLSTFTASFIISVGKTQPGKYNGTLIVDFIVLSGGPGVKCIEEYDLTISICDDCQAVEFIDSRWYEGAVGPNTYGAHLLVSIRNNYVDNMRGVVLELNLPNGIFNSHDNSSYVKIAPVSGEVAGLIQQMQIPTLEELLSIYQVEAPQTFSRGNILTFVVSVNIFDLDVGRYNADGRLSYIDQWGTRRAVNVTIPITILGRTSYVELYMNGSLNVRKRFTNASLTIVNVGSSPMYDVYIVISPYREAAILIPSPSIVYVENIAPNGRREIPIALAYNPLGSVTQAEGVAVITYGPVPLMISMVYKDASGMVKRFNNTVTIVVEPFIDLQIREVKATGTPSSSTVSGIIVNYGSATAYRVEASLKVNDVSRSTLIGDIDPGSEVAFRIDVPAYNETGVLWIRYYNIFNELNYSEVIVKIILREETTTIVTVLLNLLTIPIALAYNPLGSVTQAEGVAVITYGPVPLMISMVYKDASGMVKRFNNTVTIVVEPFIDLQIREVKATGTPSSSTVSGIIVNYGSATAYRVEASLKVNDVSRSTLIGDIDPGSEVAFRIDVPAYNETGVLWIRYYNIFNELNYSEVIVKIILREETTTTPVQSKGIGIETWIIIVAVAVFLTVSAFLIYRFLKTHSTGRA
ncbi:hypothetical protein KEJ48_02045 [Candidatus Bathyarchaeota archaeon]|nr:hypothetical protein [Candidatus Bathyarchaeota archaeon]